MTRFLTFGLIGALVLGVSGVAHANVCAIDDVPAATVLFPFVVFDYDAFRADGNGQDTIFSITNVSAEAQIVHVTVWTDFAAAILDFNILLTGYDVVSMNTSSILGRGQLPVTRNEGHNTPPSSFHDEGAIANGPVSSANSILNGYWLNPGMHMPQATSTIAAGRCDPDNQNYPGLYATPIPQDFLDLFESYLQVSQTVDRFHADDCVQPYTDSYYLNPTPFWAERDPTYPTWMYITADVVERCDGFFPDDEEYYQNQIRDDNVLLGDVFWVNESGRFSETSNAIHLEASLYLDNVGTIAPTGAPVSFYHRYSILQGQDSDYREPLPTAWAFRYLGAGLSDIGTDIRIWKGSTLLANTNDLERIGMDELSPDELVASNCHAYTYYAWDEDEMVTVYWGWPNPWPTTIPNLMPLATQEIPVDQFDVPAAFGWMLFVWPASNYPEGHSHIIPDDWYQTWMGVRYNAYGSWSAARNAWVMANYNCFSDQILPNLGVNYGYVDPIGYVTSPSVPVPPTN